MSTTRQPTTDTCPRCFERVRHTPTESHCPDCGLVVDDAPLDHGPDWGRQDGDHDPERAAPGNRNHHDRGLGSHIDRSNSELSGRAKQHHRWSKAGSKQDRARGYLTLEVARIGGALELPDSVTDRGKRIVRDAYRAEDWQNYDTLVAGAVYAACRENQQGRTSRDIEPYARCDRRWVDRALLEVASAADVELAPPNYARRVRVVAPRLDGGQRHVDDAVQLVENTEAQTMTGCSPTVIAASALYAVGPWTQERVADALDVTPVSIRNHYRELGQ